MGALELTTENFQSEVLDSDQPVLVDFWGPHCGPCRQLAPVIEELADEYSGTAKVAKLDIAAHREQAIKYQVQAVPTLIVFKNGEPVQRFMGVQPKSRLQEAIEAAQA